MPAYDQTGGPEAGADGESPPIDAAAVSVVRQLQEVDDALEHLAELPLDARVAVFTDLHQQLTAALAVTAAAPGPAPQGGPGSPSPRSR